MKKILNSMAALMIILMFSSVVAAESIKVHDAWVRSAPPNAKMLAAYMNIINESGELRVLTAVSSSMFGKVMMHKTVMNGEMMKMVPQKKMDIPADGALLLEPGGRHLMLMYPKSALRKGDHVDIELRFDNGLLMHINAPVRETKDGGMMKGHH